MDDPIAVALKFGFLAVLYLFLLWVARSSLRDLAGHGRAEIDSEPQPAPAPEARRRREKAGPDLRAGVNPQLEVIAAMGYEPGTTFDIGQGATMGRADSADIPIDDPFASSAHARIFLRGEFMYIEDMGSTNGTYLNGRQVRQAEQLKVADVVRIGESEYRYQE
jgi:pSer/pThr/pTyr-binding forkhead associated (FHA) protein